MTIPSEDCDASDNCTWVLNRKDELHHYKSGMNLIHKVDGKFTPQDGYVLADKQKALDELEYVSWNSLGSITGIEAIRALYIHDMVAFEVREDEV